MTSVNDIIAYAAAQEGKQYVFGAEGPNTFDCSGLMQYVFHRFGISLPRTAAQQAKVGTPVDKSAIAPGDLVFSDWGDGPNSHVALASGNGHIIVAPHTGTVVQQENLSPNYLKHVTAVRRIPGLDGSAAAAPSGKGTTVGFGDPITDGIVAPLVGPLQDMAKAVTGISQVADLITKAFLPSNFIRIVCGLIGGILVLLGIRLLSKEVRT